MSDERRALADRLDRMADLNERTATVMGNLGTGWANEAADLRAAAAALREDAPSADPAALAAAGSAARLLTPETP